MGCGIGALACVRSHPEIGDISMTKLEHAVEVAGIVCAIALLSLQGAVFGVIAAAILIWLSQ